MSDLYNTTRYPFTLSLPYTERTRSQRTCTDKVIIIRRTLKFVSKRFSSWNHFWDSNNTSIDGLCLLTIFLNYPCSLQRYIHIKWQSWVKTKSDLIRSSGTFFSFPLSTLNTPTANISVVTKYFQHNEIMESWP